MPSLSRAFFERSPVDVAPDLLGCRLVHQLAGRTRLLGRIVEVEAYVGDGSDPGSHTHGGRTRRNASMFGPPGHFYVYRSMGIHTCANLVCQPSGVGAGVLLRAVEPLEGLETMLANRAGRGGRELTSGPGKLTQAFGIRLGHDGAPALRGKLRVLAPAAPARFRICAGPRIGLSKATELPYRFFIADSPFVTRSKLNRAARALN